MSVRSNSTPPDGAERNGYTPPSLNIMPDDNRVTGTEFDGKYTYEWEATYGGTAAIVVDKYVRKTGKWVDHYVLPGVTARLERGRGLVYVIPFDGLDQTLEVDGKEVNRGDAWSATGWDLAAPYMERQVNKNIWYHVARTIPVTKTSPKITEALPPLLDLAEPKGHEAEARAAWGNLGRHAKPLLRFTLGFALASPWLRDVNGETFFIHLVGAPGTGKTVAARAVAGLYGPADPEEAGGIFHAFNASKQGIPSLSYSHATIPLVLDEVGKDAAEVPVAFNQLAQYGGRLMGNRTGGHVNRRDGFMSAVVTTGNSEVVLKERRFDRRLLAFRFSDLWEGGPGVVAHDDERRTYFAGVAPAYQDFYGWPFYALTHQYVPGTESALIPVSEIRDMPTLNPDMAVMAQVGLWGCQWLARWTGDPSWTEGVPAAVAYAMGSRKIADTGRDVAEVVVRDIFDPMVPWNRPQRFNPDARQADGFRRERRSPGWPSNPVPRAHCAVPHDGGCLWYDMSEDGLSFFLHESGHDGEEGDLFDSSFGEVMYRPNAPKNRRRIVMDQATFNVVTFCLAGATTLAYPEPVTVETPELDVSDAPVPSAPTPEESPAPAAEREEEPEPEAEEPTPARRFIGWLADPASMVGPKPSRQDYADPAAYRDAAAEYQVREDQALAEGLRQAVMAGCTDVVGPKNWRLAQVPGWEANNLLRQVRQTEDDEERAVRRANNAGTAILHGPGGSKVRAWRCDANLTPETMVQALDGMFRLDPEFRGTASLAVRMIRSGNKGSVPRYQLPEPYSSMWTSRTIMFPAKSAGVKPSGCWQYDRNKAHLISMRSADVFAMKYVGEGDDRVREDYTAYGPDAPVGKDPTTGANLVGMYEVTVPDWDAVCDSLGFGDLRGLSPFGQVEPGRTGWVSHEVMRLAVRDMHVPVTIHRAYLGQSSDVPGLHTASKTVSGWLDLTKGTPTATLVKGTYATIAGKITSDSSQGSHGNVFRPDWGAAIRELSWANVYRRMLKVREATGMVPAFMNVDALYYRDRLPDSAPLPMGDAVGQYKIESEG